MHTEIVVGDSVIADHGAWMYVIHAPSWQALYIGQTFSAGGALARLSQHLSHGTSATFRQRLCAIRGYHEITIGEVRFLACRLLRGGRKFTQQEYREAVEWRVQGAVLNALAERRVPMAVVSRVRANGYVRDLEVTAEAEGVVERFRCWFDRGSALAPSTLN